MIAAPGQQWDVAWTAATLHAGSQTVRLSFINDAHNPATKEDRNVAVARLMLAPIKPLASACLMQPNALVKGSFGKGSVLIDQIRWETDCAGSPASGRYVSNLLTNLGAEFGARGTVIPAERFAFEREGPAFSIRNGRAYLGANGTITCRIAFAQAGPREFRIRARGTEMDGVFPIMAVRIDGRSVGEVSLRRAGWQTVALVVQAPAGTYDLSLAFTNDAYRPPEDRNLTIESVEIRPGGAPAQRH